VLRVWLKGEEMLEIKKYTKSELADEIGGSSSREALKKKLTRYDVEFEIEGRAAGTIFNIKKICNPFKLYCRTELNLVGQTDFEKGLYFCYYFFCDNEFAMLTDVEKEKYMDDSEEVEHTSRQTIRNWELRFERFGWIHFGKENCAYYFAKGGNHRRATREEYSEAWKYYWSERQKGEEVCDIIGEIVVKYGGVPRKHIIPEKNAFYMDELNKFIDIVVETVEGRRNETNS
jgi:hypothetical protein